MISLTSVHAETQTIAGKWKTIDDETGNLKSIVLIWEDNQVFSGKVEQLFRKPDEEQNPICDKCTDDRKNQPVLGMTILKDLVEKDGEWSGGTILDPKNGKVYRCFLKLEDNGKKLKVRGYIGISLLGRTQVWERAE